MKFEWDDSKATANRRKHGVSFEDAASVFYDPFALEAHDSEHSNVEDRWKTIGMAATSWVLVVVTTDLDLDRVRIISARKASAREVSDYEEEIQRRTGGAR